jgi:Protein of unknown function, DUF599
VKQKVSLWLQSIQAQNASEILAVQTIRNSLMAASVLASTALVGLMGVLATAHLHPKWGVGVAGALVTMITRSIVLIQLASGLLLLALLVALLGFWLS